MVNIHRNEALHKMMTKSQGYRRNSLASRLASAVQLGLQFGNDLLVLLTARQLSLLSQERRVFQLLSQPSNLRLALTLRLRRFVASTTELIELSAQRIVL